MLAEVSRCHLTGATLPPVGRAGLVVALHPPAVTEVRQRHRVGAAARANPRSDEDMIHLMPRGGSIGTTTVAGVNLAMNVIEAPLC